MSFNDWLQNTKERYRTQPPSTATKTSARRLLNGAFRRTLDEWIGVNWWERDDWDILVVMDATRVDLAQETLDEPVKSVWSNASTSIDWIERHFADAYQDDWEDAAYITANPFAQNDSESARSADLDEKPLGAFEPVYADRWTKEPVGTTPPEAVTERAVTTWGQTDVDRMIVHYMQPHQPFRSRPDWETVYSNLENLTTELNQGGPDIWARVRDGEMPKAEAWDAYKDNLWWVWCNIHTDLIPNVSGQVLVTADHGNALGEFGAWGHHGGMMNPHTRKVPVLGPYTTGLDVSDTETDYAYVTGETDEQLTALGYK